MVHAILLLPLLPLIIKQSFAKILLATNGSAAIPKSAVVDATAPKVVAYYLGYSNYRPGAPFTALEIDGSKLTHLIYGFLDVNMTLPGQVELASGDPWADLNRPFGYMNSWNCPCCVQGNFEQLYLLKRKYPHLQTLLSIGGWEYSTLISDAVLTAENRKKFAESCVQWTINYGFDGIDLDWEFPRKFNAYSVINDILYEMQVIGGKDGTKHNENDCFNMEAFLQELRRQFDALGYNKRFLITLTLFWTLEFNFQCVDFFKVKNSIDWVNIIAYEMMWSANFTRHHSPLFPGVFKLNPSVSTAMAGHTVMGSPASLFMMGVSVYGRSFRAVMPERAGKNAATSDGNNMPYTDSEFPVVSYDDIVNFKSDPKLNYKYFWDDAAASPYLFNPNSRIFISFDNPRSIAAKANWSNSNGFGGIFLYDIGYDLPSSDPESILTATFKGISADKNFRMNYDVMCVKSPLYCNIDCDPTPPPEYDPTVPLDPLIQNCSRPGDVTLVFTGGPSEMTLSILRELSSINVNATFLISGNRIVGTDPRFAGLVLQAQRKGHLIGQLGFSFQPYNKMSDDDLHGDVRRANDALSFILGQRPLFTGLPMRQYDLRIHYALNLDGMRLIYPSLDQRAVQAQQNITILEAVRRGGSAARKSWIISLSDFTDQQQGTVTELVKDLRQQNYRIVDMATCYNGINYPQYSKVLSPKYFDDVSLFKNSYYEACGSEQPGQVVFAFHGGPVELLPQLLGYGLQKNIRVIIGIVGSIILENAYYKSYILRAYTEGHIIAHHGYNYTDFRALSDEQILLNMKKSDEILSNLLGVMPRYFLAPFGRLDRRVIAVLQNSGYTPLTASIDSFDAIILSNSSIKNGARMISDRLDQLLINTFDQPQQSSFILTQQMIYFRPVLQDLLIQRIRANGYSPVMPRDCLPQPLYTAVKVDSCGDKVCFYALENCKSCPQDCGECTDEYYKQNSIDQGQLAFISLVDSFVDRLWILIFISVGAAIVFAVCSYRFYLWNVRSHLREEMKAKLDAQLQADKSSSSNPVGNRPDGRRRSSVMDEESVMRRRKV